MNLKVLLLSLVVLISGVAYANAHTSLNSTVKQLERMILSFYPVIHRGETEQNKQARFKFPANSLRAQLQAMNHLLLQYKHKLDTTPTLSVT